MHGTKIINNYQEKTLRPHFMWNIQRKGTHNQWYYAHTEFHKYSEF